MRCLRGTYIWSDNNGQGEEPGNTRRAAGSKVGLIYRAATTWLVGRRAKNSGWQADKGNLGNHNRWQEKKEKAEKDMGGRNRKDAGDERCEQERSDEDGDGQKKNEKNSVSVIGNDWKGEETLIE